MHVIEELQMDYDIEKIVGIKDIAESSACYLVSTVNRQYVYKQVSRTDFVSIYARVAQVLNHKGLPQGRIIPSSSGALMTDKGFCLLEYLVGDVIHSFDRAQHTEVIQYLVNYNRALQEVPFNSHDLKEVNNWDKVRSTSFLCENVESIINQCGLDNQTACDLEAAGKLLADNLAYMNASNKQLVHSDLGPGNIIFRNGHVYSFIDFTPDYQHELYSLSQFLYWTCLWRFEEDAEQRIVESVQVYGSDRTSQTYSPEVLFLYLVQACLFRIMGPALNILEKNTFRADRINGRLIALQRLLALRVIMGH